MKRLPVPDLSQKMSGLLRPKWLPVTELFRGFADRRRNGSVDTTIPPETGVGPEGTLPERWFPVTSIALAPRSAIPMPEKPAFLEYQLGTNVCCSRPCCLSPRSHLQGTTGKLRRTCQRSYRGPCFRRRSRRGCCRRRCPTRRPRCCCRRPSRRCWAFRPKMVIPALPERLTSSGGSWCHVESMIPAAYGTVSYRWRGSWSRARQR